MSSTYWGGNCGNGANSRAYMAPTIRFALPSGPFIAFSPWLACQRRLLVPIIASPGTHTKAVLDNPVDQLYRDAEMLSDHCHAAIPALFVTGLLLSPPDALAAESSPPACSTAAHGDFDFWVGNWDVYQADGKLAGTNHIEKILAGCVVFENWNNASSPYAGKSFNTFDPVSGAWNQVWVDTGGSTIHFSGRRTGNVMDMTGSQATADGTMHFRMSYTLNDDGTVRQLWQQSADQKQWEVIFDGLYRRN